MEFKIREMCREDNPAVADLIRRNLEAHKLDIPGTVYFDPILDTIYEYYLEDETSSYYVMTDSNNRVVGGVGLGKLKYIPECAELQKLYLSDEVKGRGLGYKLVSFIEDKMRERGYKKSYLETHHNLKTAIHLYNRCGYKEIERPEEVVHGAMTGFYIKNL